MGSRVDNLGSHILFRPEDLYFWLLVFRLIPFSFYLLETRSLKIYVL